ncbi:MAG: hypothetical protein KF838_01135 [Phycisphaeraceae bacterium]|nr:MAG: hypothetical protein KF838_01135 [Phycisphaeraceae bacterium]
MKLQHTIVIALVPLARLPLPGAEIPAFDPVSQRLLITSASDVHAFEMRDPPGLRGVGFARLGTRGDDVTHVAIDPAGRGFVAACLVPEKFGTRHGHVVFIDPVTLREIGRVAVGHNPDSCAFSPGGEFLVVANEGQPERLSTGEIVDPPGSVTVVDLRQVRGVSDLASLGESRVKTMLLSGPALDEAMASRTPPRISPRLAHSPALDLEPEYVLAPSNQTAYVTLQENNAIAVISLDPPEVLRIVGLGLVTRDLDGSDVDGPLGSTWAVETAPMPDQLAGFSVGRRKYLALAEEGDTRGTRRSAEEDDELADVARLGDLAAWWGVDEGAIPKGITSRERLGRLHVLTDLADRDGNGRVDSVVAPGSRSLGIYDAETLERVGDTGSVLEVSSLALFGDDSRSDDRGPEPEGVVVASIGGGTFAFVSLERPGAVACIDLGEPDRPRLVSIYPSAWDGDLGPEGMCIIDLPGGRTGLVVCYETSGTVVVYEIVVRD